MFFLFLFVVDTILLIVGGMLYVTSVLAGEPLWVYSYWLTEIMAGFYWFLSVYFALRGTLNKETHVTGLRRYVTRWAGNLLLLHAVQALLLSLIVLPGIVPWYTRLAIAYPGTLLVTVIIPLLILPLRYKRWNRRQESEKVRPGKIRAWAMRNPEARRFTELFPECSVYVFDHTVKNNVATCLFAHRAPRPERGGLMEEIVLEIPLDMKSKQSLEGRVHSMRYIFETGERGASVLHLDEEKSFEEYDLYARLDEDTLYRFDGLMDRFPSLENKPFPLAVRNCPYEEL